MKLVIFSDVHGNLPALELMIRKTKGMDGYICLGDTVSYGPWSNECIETVRKLKNVNILLGNHEEYFINGNYTGNNELVKTFFQLSSRDFKYNDYLKTLSREYSLNSYLFCHTIKNSRIYPHTNIKLDNNYVIGHSHYQFILKNGGYKLINPGSVGQNRKFINVINYAIYDTILDEFELKGEIYDHKKIINEMIKRNYAKQCIDYYMKKPLYR